MAKITNTLTRLHKIAERIAQRRQQVAEAIQQGVAPEHLDASVLAVRGAALTEKASFAIDESLAKHDELASAYVAVRNALAAANVQAGVAKVLAEQEALKRRITMLTAIKDSQSDAVSQGEAKDIFEARAGTEESSRRGPYASMSVTFLCADRLAHVVSELKQSEQALARLSDKLADCNATRITVEIADSVAADLGLA